MYIIFDFCNVRSVGGAALITVGLVQCNSTSFPVCDRQEKNSIAFQELIEDKL